VATGPTGPLSPSGRNPVPSDRVLRNISQYGDAATGLRCSPAGNPCKTSSRLQFDRDCQKAAMPPEVPEKSRPTFSATLRKGWELVAAGLRIGGAWIRANRLKAGLLAGGCLLVVGGVVAWWLATAMTGSVDGALHLDVALEALDEGEYLEAQRVARMLRDERAYTPDALGGPAFVLGAVAAWEANMSWTSDKNDFYLLSARYLEEARKLGFPPGRHGEGLYLLGRSLCLSGQTPASRPVLREALKSHRAKKTEICLLLADAYLNDANPKCPEALDYITTYLSDQGLPVEARHQGLARRAQILLQLGKIAECTSTLEKIPSDAANYAEAIVVRGQVLIHEARALQAAAQPPDGHEPPEAAPSPDASTPGAENQAEALQKYQAAVNSLRLAQDRATLSTQAGRKAMYLIGVCLLESEDYRAALTQFDRTRRTHPETPEALSATFRAGELLQRLGRGTDALAAYYRALAQVSDPRDYNNPWIPLEELRRRTREAYRDYLEAEDFEACLRFTRFLHPLFPQWQALELEAEAHHAWGRALLAPTDHLPPNEAKPLWRRGREQFRRAGQDYERLAKLRTTTRFYPDDLWNSAENYLEGHDYENAARLLGLYLKSESRRRHPRALADLGAAMLALGRSDEALKAFRECIEFHPRDAASYRARLGASQAHLEKGETQRAEELLRENLNGEDLTPTSEEWRHSLFGLGRLLHREGRYGEAIRRLEEALSRYPDSAGAGEARYLIADSYRQHAELLEEELEKDLIETARVARSKKVYELLHSALEHYRRAQVALIRRQETTELTRVEKSMLRNCCFAIGDVLFDLGQYDDAIKAYSAAGNRYQDEPEVLEAYVQTARAYRQLDKPQEARGSLEQAKLLLKRMQATADFQKTTNYDPIRDGRARRADSPKTRLPPAVGRDRQEAARAGEEREHHRAVGRSFGQAAGDRPPAANREGPGPLPQSGSRPAPMADAASAAGIGRDARPVQVAVGPGHGPGKAERNRTDPAPRPGGAPTSRGPPGQPGPRGLCPPAPPGMDPTRPSFRELGILPKPSAGGQPDLVRYAGASHE